MNVQYFTITKAVKFSAISAHFILVGLLSPYSQALAQTSIMPLGDSVTRGTFNSFFSSTIYPESAYRNQSSTPPSSLRSYREHLHDLLIDSNCNADIEWVGTQTQAGRTPAIHEGHSGWAIDRFLTDTWADTTGVYGGSEDLSGWLSLIQPEIILLHLGSNDMNQGQTAISTEEELEDMLDVIYAENPNTIVVLANMIPIYGWFGDQTFASQPAPNVQGEAETLTSLLPNLVSEQQALVPNREIYLIDVNSGYYADVNNVVSCPAGSGGDPQNMTLSRCINQPGSGGAIQIPDGIHPNLIGDKFIADQLFQVLDNDIGICPGIPDTQVPVASIATPANAGDLVPSAATFDGSATDQGGSGFHAIEVGIQDPSTLNWFDFSLGTFSSSSQKRMDAVLSNQTAAATDWELSVTLPDGDYRLYARARDNANNLQAWNTRNFSVGAQDTEDPVAIIDTPANVGDAMPSEAVFDGSATDQGGSGFDAIEVAIYESSTQSWFDFSLETFSSSSQIRQDATLSNQTTASTDWALSVTLPEGSYRVYVRGLDNANNRQAWTTRNFIVDAPDTQDPVSTIETPANVGDTMPPAALFDGSATDQGGSGIDAIEVAIYEPSAQSWFDFSLGTFSSSSLMLMDATLSNQTTASTDWVLSAMLPDGNYRVYVRGRDNANNRETWNTRNFNVSVPDTQDPIASISTPASAGDNVPASATFDGSATDQGGSGFDAIEVAIYEPSTQTWFDYSLGTFSSAGVVRMDATLSNQTTASTDWQLSTTLPPGSYRLYVRARDNANNLQPWNRRNFVVAIPDIEDPMASISTPASAGDDVPASATFVGSATDQGGSGFDAIEVAIYEPSTQTWFDYALGSFSSAGVISMDAALSNQTTASTNWQLSTTLPPGSYRLYVRARDNANNLQSWNRRGFVVSIPDIEDPIASISTPASAGDDVPASATFDGSATDQGGSGFDAIEVAIYEPSTQTWFDYSLGTFSSAGVVRMDATLSNQTTASTNWQLSTTLPPGSYRLYVRARDNANNLQSWNRRGFNVN